MVIDKRVVTITIAALILYTVMNRTETKTPPPQKQEQQATVVALVKKPLELPEKATEQQKKEDGAKARVKFANDQEGEYLSKGFDFSITTSGQDKTTIKYESVWVSRVFLYKTINEGVLLEMLSARGFKKAIFTNRYGQTWTCDLTVKPLTLR